jgi:hypothetical protein
VRLRNGRTRLLEAVPWWGVVTKSVYSEVPSSILRVRRHPALSEVQRFTIALCAQRKLGSGYSLMRAIKAGAKSQISSWTREWFAASRDMIVCSKFYYDAHIEITRELLRGRFETP